MKDETTDRAARRRRRRRRIGVGVALVLAAALASPFLFPATFVRYYLNHSDLKRLGIRLGGARLRPGGSLELYDLAMDDTGENAGRPLLSASTVRIDFSWTGLLSSRLQHISVENLHAYLRPGTDVPLTLLQALTSGEPAAPGAPPGKPVWFDQLYIRGWMTIEGYGPWQAALQIGAAERLPLEAAVTMSGSPAAANHDVSVVAGDPAAGKGAPVVASRLRVASTAGGDVNITIPSLAVTNLHPVISRTMIEQWLGSAAPPMIQGGCSGQMAGLYFSGSLTLGSAARVNGTVTASDLSARTIAEGDAASMALDHWTAETHVEGRLSGAPFKDLAFSRSHCTWDGWQYGDWRLSHGVSDWRVDGTQIVLVSLQAEAPSGQILADGAYDTATGDFPRAQVWLKNASVAAWMERLPPPLRAQLPCTAEGTGSAHVYLADSDAGHFGARVEVTCPEDLTLRMRRPIDSSGPAATSAAAAPGAAATQPGLPARLTNLNVSGLLTWSRRWDSPPELTRGRVTADVLEVMSPARAWAAPAPVVAEKVGCDLSLTQGVVRVNQVHANLADGATLSADAQYTLHTQTLDHGGVTLTNINAGLANPWLPAGFHLMGQFTSQVQCMVSPSSASLSGSLECRTPTTIGLPAGTIALTGSAGPSIALHGALQRDTGVVEIESAEIDGLREARIDRSITAWLRRAAGPGDANAGENELEVFKDGATASFDKVAATGRLDMRAGRFTGSVALVDMSLAGLPEAAKPVGFDNLTLTAAVESPLTPSAILHGAKISGGRLAADKVTLGDHIVASIAATLNAADSRLTVNDASFKFADGAFSGDATASYAVAPNGTGTARLDRLNLKFSGLDQAIVTKTLAPSSFTAEGVVNGTLELAQDRQGVLAGKVIVDADSPGRLKISRAIASEAFARPAKEAMVASGSPVPANLEDIAVAQFENYLYSGGHAELEDGPGGALLVLDYSRVPLKEGDPGYGVKVPVAGQELAVSYLFELHGQGVRFPNYSVARALAHSFGLEDLLARRPATRPESMPATAPQAP